MKTDRSNIKIIVAIFAASAMMASCNTLVPLLAKIRESFPDQSVSRVQMVFTLTSHSIAICVLDTEGSA